MPKLNRRSFLQLIGAASLAPAIPALPARAAATGGASHAQLLWAGLYKNAGTASKFARVTKGLGISPTTAHRLHAKLAGSRVMMAEGAVRMRRAARPAPRAMKAATKGEPSSKRSLSEVRKLMVEDAHTEGDAVSSPEVEDQDDAIETPKPSPLT